VNDFSKQFTKKIGILVQGGTVNVGEVHLEGEMSRQEYRNRKALLNNVKTSWVDGVLEKSLHEQISIVLGLEDNPNAVASPWNLNLINADQSRKLLPAGTPTIDVFDQMGEGGTLLVLGEPGSGKTISLLQLARDLIARAEQDNDRRIPVVLNLSSWASEKQPIAKWIVEELNSKYQVNRKIGQRWVEKQELLLLMDGLDEIRDLKDRNACVIALNTFQQEQATEMVVCCRIKDYEQMGNRLKLKSALVLQPLSLNQIDFYLNQLKADLKVLKTMLIQDATLQELAPSPLLLNIMVLAYQGIEIADIPVSTINSNRKKQLFDDYINRMFQGSRLVAYHPSYQSQEKQRYSRKSAMHWLIWIAKQQTFRYFQTIWLIEKMQPHGLSDVEVSFYIIGIVVIYGLFGYLIKGLIGCLISWLIILIIVLLKGFNLMTEENQFSYQEFIERARYWMAIGLIVGLIWGVALGCVFLIFSKITLINILVNVLFFIIVTGGIFGLIGGLQDKKIRYQKQCIKEVLITAFNIVIKAFKIFGLALATQTIYYIEGKNPLADFLVNNGLRIDMHFFRAKMSNISIRQQILLIKSVESIKWSWWQFEINFRTWMFIGLRLGLLLALFFGFFGVLLFIGFSSSSSPFGLTTITIGVGYVLISIISLGLGFGLVGGIMSGLVCKEIEAKNYPNQGIKKSAINALIFIIVGCLVGWLVGLTNLGLFFGLAFGTFFGGLAFIQHLVLRLILFITWRIPLNYAKFLDWASDKLFLQKVGGGYIFIHRSLMEHFAEMEGSQ